MVRKVSHTITNSGKISPDHHFVPIQNRVIQMEECKVHLLPQIHQKIHLHMEHVSQNTYRMLAEDITLLKGQKESPYNQVGPTKRIWAGPSIPWRELWKTKGSHTLLVGRKGDWKYILKYFWNLPKLKKEINPGIRSTEGPNRATTRHN